jgi:hypothetical protein
MIESIIGATATVECRDLFSGSSTFLRHFSQIILTYYVLVQCLLLTNVYRKASKSHGPRRTL